MEVSGYREKKLRLKNKICVVTGSSRGIGAAIARGFAKEGAHVVITYNTNSEKAKEIAQSIGSELILKLEGKEIKSVMTF